VIGAALRITDYEKRKTSRRN